MPIPIAMAVAIYFTMWWIVLFAVLPFGVQSQDGEPVVPGADRGAPRRPLMLKKALWTTAISAVLFTSLLLMIKWL